MLQKKIERSRDFLAAHRDLFRCPLCYNQLNQLNGYQLSCENGHQYDLNKKGTLHFLGHKIKTEYNREMLFQRQQMIKAGLYQPMLEKIASLIDESNADPIIDLGCGEGSFLNELSELGVTGSKIGFDISKEGIALATEQPEPAFWCVADLTNLPFTDQSASYLLNIFSPSHYQEFRRVLKPQGRLIKVVPGANYLKELRELFYEDAEAKQAYSNEKVVAKFSEEMTLITTEKVSYQFPVPENLQTALLEMSPLQWGASAASLANARTELIKKITIEVEILVGET